MRPAPRQPHRVSTCCLLAAALALLLGVPAAGQEPDISRLGSDVRQLGAHPRFGVAGLDEGLANVLASRMVRLMKGWERDTGREVTADLTRYSDTLAMARFLYFEDGVYPPIRTGHEFALYQRIKTFAVDRRPGQRLSVSDLFRMGLDTEAHAAPGPVSIESVFLTVHNVLKLLARPQQWVPPEPGRPVSMSVDYWTGSTTPGELDHYGHGPDDPAYDVMMDILGTARDGRSLPEIMGIRRRPNGTPIDTLWSMTLFGEHGIFELLAGSQNAPTDFLRTSWNGGCHYYYWVGALARLYGGSTGVWFGGGIEESVKASVGNEEARGAVEVSHFRAGAVLARMIQDEILARRTASPAPATEPRTGPPAAAPAPRTAPTNAWVLTQVVLAPEGAPVVPNAGHPNDPFKRVADGATVYRSYRTALEASTGSPIEPEKMTKAWFYFDAPPGQLPGGRFDRPDTRRGPHVAGRARRRGALGLRGHRRLRGASQGGRDPRALLRKRPPRSPWPLAQHVIAPRGTHRHGPHPRGR